MIIGAKELLEGCASLMLVNRMGSFEHFQSSLSEPLHDLWDFASDHPPVGAKIVLKGSGFGALNLASFNVLNMHYMKFIDTDWQGLKGSKMQQSPAEQRAEELVSVILRILHHPSHPKAVLCLQDPAFCSGALLFFLFCFSPVTFSLKGATQHETLRSQSPLR